METNETKDTKKAWGGARKGAGRKKTVNASVNINFRVDADLCDLLKAQPNVSRFVNDAIREKLGVPKPTALL